MARTNKIPLILFAMDLNGFKLINDRLGHSSGDLVLIEVGNVLKFVFRDSDIIARSGGDEFLVLVVNSEANNIEILKERLSVAMKSCNSVIKHRMEIGLSVGTATFDGTTDDSLDDLINQADSEMYLDKRGGE